MVSISRTFHRRGLYHIFCGFHFSYTEQTRNKGVQPVFVRMAYYWGSRVTSLKTNHHYLLTLMSLRNSTSSSSLGSFSNFFSTAPSPLLTDKLLYQYLPNLIKVPRCVCSVELNGTEPPTAAFFYRGNLRGEATNYPRNYLQVRTQSQQNRNVPALSLRWYHWHLYSWRIVYPGAGFLNLKWKFIT